MWSGYIHHPPGPEGWGTNCGKNLVLKPILKHACQSNSVWEQLCTLSFFKIHSFGPVSLSYTLKFRWLVWESWIFEDDIEAPLCQEGIHFILICKCELNCHGSLTAGRSWKRPVEILKVSKHTWISANARLLVEYHLVKISLLILQNGARRSETWIVSFPPYSLPL